MSAKISLAAEMKTGSGKGAARALRRSSRIPAIIYGGKTPVMVSLIAKDFVKEYHKGGMQSKLIEIEVDGKAHSVLLRDVQLNAVTDFPEHIDFQEIRKGEPIKVSIRLKLVNESRCPGLKKGGVLNVTARTIPCHCRDLNIPEFIEVDLEKLEIGSVVHIQDISLASGVSPVASGNFAILSISGREDEAAATSEAPKADKAGS